MFMNITQIEFQTACAECGVKEKDQQALSSFLTPLRDKEPTTHLHYLHLLRVGLLARKIGQFTHRDERALLMAGATHDLGKCQVCLSALGRVENWSKKDQREIEGHVLDGYRILRGRFDFTADTMVRHHSFQDDGYPKRPPKFLHAYSPPTTQLLIAEHARIVALADVYDALHRPNDKFSELKTLSGAEIKDLMLRLNPDREKLVTALYEANIFGM